MNTPTVVFGLLVFYQLLYLSGQQPIETNINRPTEANIDGFIYGKSDSSLLCDILVGYNERTNQKTIECLTVCPRELYTKYGDECEHMISNVWCYNGYTNYNDEKVFVGCFAVERSEPTPYLT